MRRACVSRRAARFLIAVAADLSDMTIKRQRAESKKKEGLLSPEEEAAKERDTYAFAARNQCLA